MEETDTLVNDNTIEFIRNNLSRLGSPAVDKLIHAKIEKLKLDADNRENRLYIRILYAMLDRNIIGPAEIVEKVAMLCGLTGAVFYILRVTKDGGLSILSQLFWAIDSALLGVYFYETRQYPIILTQVANAILSVYALYQILAYYPDAWSSRW